MNKTKKENYQPFINILKEKLKKSFNALSNGDAMGKFLSLSEDSQNEIMETIMVNIKEQYETDQQRQLYEYCASEEHIFGDWTIQKRILNSGLVEDLPNTPHKVSFSIFEYLNTFQPWNFYLFEKTRNEKPFTNYSDSDAEFRMQARKEEKCNEDAKKALENLKLQYGDGQFLLCQYNSPSYSAIDSYEDIKNILELSEYSFGEGYYILWVPFCYYETRKCSVCGHIETREIEEPKKYEKSI